MTKKAKKAEPRILITGQVREHCTVCGALPGFLHHDPSYRKGLVVLAKYKGQQLCQLCRQGAREAALDFKKVKGNPMTNANNKRRALLGRKAFTAYAEASKMEAIERRQDYSITDAIVDLLHFAVSRKQDAEMILRSANNHFTAEVSGEEI